jgi:hypothetical protein
LKNYGKSNQRKDLKTNPDYEHSTRGSGENNRVGQGIDDTGWDSLSANSRCLGDGTQSPRDSMARFGVLIMRAIKNMMAENRKKKRLGFDLRDHPEPVDPPIVSRGTYILIFFTLAVLLGLFTGALVEWF